MKIKNKSSPLKITPGLCLGLFVFFAFITFVDQSFAQQIPVKTDSTLFYRNIESYSKRSKFKNFMYRLFFKPVLPDKENFYPGKKQYKKLIQKPYSTFEGKIIRNIDIVTLDPFGFSITDTTAAKLNFLTKSGNTIHIRTKNIAIRNLLLIRKNQPFNALFVKESERLIRSQKFVHDVSFYVASTGVKSDSVDIFIRELDKWSIIPEGSITASKFRIDVTDNNFLGFGHEFRNAYSRNLIQAIDSFNTNYFIPNIRNTYINTKLHFGVDGYGNHSGSLAIDRPFFSPLAKWAAGVSLITQSKNDSLKNMNSVYTPVKLKFNIQDFWAGKAIRVFKGNEEKERLTNLIITGRFLRVRYSEKPSALIDPLHMYSNEDFYLTGIGITTRKYVQDKFIFKYGVTEDVPVGKVLALTGGYQLRNNAGRPYLGARFSFGNYYTWGYLSSSFEYGTFFHASHAEQGVFTAGADYFTGLLEAGKWRFREFIKTQVTIGINRFSYDSLTINDDPRIDRAYVLNGFYSPALSGTQRLLFTLQTQSYAPWSVIGFHFGPFLIWSFGLLGNAKEGFRNSRVYSQIGLGVIIKNENLVFNSFQISISFYPLIPGVGQNVVKLNSFATSDFGLRDFEIGKPSGNTYY
jgi:hypothetical protein